MSKETREIELALPCFHSLPRKRNVWPESRARCSYDAYKHTSQIYIEQHLRVLALFCWRIQVALLVGILFHKLIVGHVATLPIALVAATSEPVFRSIGPESRGLGGNDFGRPSRARYIWVLRRHACTWRHSSTMLVSKPASCSPRAGPASQLPLCQRIGCTRQ